MPGVFVAEQRDQFIGSGRGQAGKGSAYSGGFIADPPDASHPQRFIQTALREWAYATAYETSIQRASDLPIWLHRYNWHRPHGSLKAKTPISRLGLSVDNLLRLHI